MERLVSRSWDRKYQGRDCEDYNLTIDGFMDFLGFGNNGVRNYSRNRARSNGFRAISGPETQTTNNQSSERATETGDSSNSISNISENAEIRESLLVLENNYNSYHRIIDATNQYIENQFGILRLRNIVVDELINHELPTTVRNVDAIVGRFYQLRTEIEGGN